MIDHVMNHAIKLIVTCYLVIIHCCTDHGEFVIEKIVYEKDKVLVSGPFDADKLSPKLCCKAGRIIKKN